MKKFALLCFLLFSISAIGQNKANDIIYLKDGSMLKGQIIERTNDGAIKMLLENGREITVSMREVNQVTVEGIGTNTADYGGKTAFGLGIIGDGGIEGHFRFKADEELIIDLSIQPDFTQLVNDITNESRFEGGLGVGAELNYFFGRRFKETKQKVRANGLFLRGARGFNEYTSTKLNFGWVSEYFRLNRFKRGFQLNLGLGYQINHWLDDPKNQVYSENRKKYQLGPYLRLQWNFFQ